MRLIDADAVRDDFMASVYAICSCDSDNSRVNCIIDAFDDLPTIESESVSHGKWLTWEDRFPGKIPKKKNNLGVFCSECGLHADNDSTYCPNCGARMDVAEK